MKALAAVLVVAGALVALAAGRGAGKDESAAVEITDYQKWKPVNPQPYFVPAPNAALCAAASAVSGPHSGKFIKVYVNKAGQAAMLSSKEPQFPVGSVVVKEKMARRDSTRPELMTVMIKREAGFNPDHGDWEFMAVNGADITVEDRGKLSNCQSCHDGVKEADYTFRTYLPKPPRKGKT